MPTKWAPLLSKDWKTIETFVCSCSGFGVLGLGFGGGGGGRYPVSCRNCSICDVQGLDFGFGPTLLWQVKRRCSEARPYAHCSPPSGHVPKPQTPNTQ